MSTLQRDARAMDCIAASFPVRTRTTFHIHADEKAIAEEIATVISKVTGYDIESKDSGKARWFAAEGVRVSFAVYYEEGR